MQSKTEDFVTDLEAYPIQEPRLKIFELYEEYSHSPIADTITKRKENFNRADLKARRELLTLVEGEVKEFHTWLEETKNLEPTVAHYYSVSLKSLLLGLPIGVHVAQLFDTIFNIQTGK
jgi:hypothetical protein